MRQVRAVFDSEGATGLGSIRDVTGRKSVRDRRGPEPLREVAVPGILRDAVTLDGDGSRIAQARHRAADFLARARDEYGLPVCARAMDVTRLVVSELVTNATKYAPGPVLMELRVVGALVEVVVRDGEPMPPVARPADARRVGQHGLEIVMAVAQDFRVQPERSGKRVTVRIALTDDADGAAAGSRTP